MTTLDVPAYTIGFVSAAALWVIGKAIGWCSRWWHRGELWTSIRAHEREQSTRGWEGPTSYDPATGRYRTWR